MKKLEVIQNIQKIISTKNNFYYLGNNKLFKNKQEIISLEDKFSGSFHIFKDKIIIQRYKGTASIYINEYLEKDIIEGYYNYLNKYSITFLNTKQNKLYEYINGKLKETSFHENGYFIDGKYLTIELKLFDYYKGNFLWHYDLSQLGAFMFRSEGERSYEVQSFIGVVDNILWIEISNCNILLLDVDTGKLIKRLDYNGIGVGTGNYILDEENNRIVCLSSSKLHHINLQTTEIKLIKDYKNEEKAESWTFGRKTLNNNKIYFTGSKGNDGNIFFNKRIGVMDANSGEVLWGEKLDLPVSKGLDTPQVSEDKLYVLATNGDLYIFEKE